MGWDPIQDAAICCHISTFQRLTHAGIARLYGAAAWLTTCERESRATGMSLGCKEVGGTRTEEEKIGDGPEEWVARPPEGGK